MKAIKKTLLWLLVLTGVGGCTFAMVDETKRQHEATVAAMNAWVGHDVYASVEASWTEPDYIIEGKVLGWRSGYLFVQDVTSRKIHPVRLDRITARNP